MKCHLIAAHWLIDTSIEWTGWQRRHGTFPSWASDSNGAKNNDLGPEPSDFRSAASQNPSPGARFEKTHSRTVIENQDPAESNGRDVSAWGLSKTTVCEIGSPGRSLFFAPLLSEPRVEPSSGKFLVRSPTKNRDFAPLAAMPQASFSGKSTTVRARWHLVTASLPLGHVARLGQQHRAHAGRQIVHAGRPSLM